MDFSVLLPYYLRTRCRVIIQTSANTSRDEKQESVPISLLDCLPYSGSGTGRSHQYGEVNRMSEGCHRNGFDDELLLIIAIVILLLVLVTED